MLIAFLVAAAAAAALQAPRPSFDCSAAATPVEIDICREPKLAAADSLMGRLFGEARVSAFGEGPSGELAVQRRWLGSRSAACRKPEREERVECLLRLYKARNRDLAVAALFRQPSIALPALYELDPEGAPLVEAIYLYSGEGARADWKSKARAARRARIVGLLAPLVRRLASDEASYGREILASDGIRTAGDALASDESFNAFIRVSSAYVEGEPVPRTFPCAAILRNPALIEASGSVFGSTLDAFILEPDCDETLPPTPGFDALVGRLVAGWPNCEGTIRFAGYRGFSQEVLNARLATGPAAASLKPSPLPRRKGVSQADVKAAIADLAGYYRRYRRASPAEAPSLAAERVTAVMSAAQQCLGD